MLLLMVALLAGQTGLLALLGSLPTSTIQMFPASWYFLLYDRVKAENISPPVAARVFGDAGGALYQPCRAGCTGTSRWSAS